jgi:3-phosphoshikimate 1-carboxyvinyltransferase
VEIKVKKSQLCGEVICPPSKSYSHRAILISSLASGKSHIDNVLVSRDTLASIGCAKMLGVSVNFLNKKSDYRVDLKSDGPDNYSTNTASGPKRVGDDLMGAEDLLVDSIGGRKGFSTPEDVLHADNSGTTIRIA